ncbi:MAG: 23S rRNA (adenine(2503)-C(2))-methyltransferase RlmN [Anaerolineales bacterium]|nr:23S rRNA (adenine(2503)-C(2))-methyltransferase RlmN [Anaerolineales bacterium]
MRLIHDLPLPALTSFLVELGEPAYRAQQIWQGLYQHFYNSPDQFTNLSISLRAKLAENLQFEVLTPISQLVSSDKQTIKTLFRLHDGQAIEAVLMRYGDPASSEAERSRDAASTTGLRPYAQRGRKQGRRTLCISTQVGCAMGCVFCATGQMGFRRQLSCGEIVAQVMYYARLLDAQGEKVTNVVVMGMGEPFHNYDNTMAAIDRLNDPQGYNFGARRFTISTVGLVPAIRRFTRERRQVNLAISLHAADDALRSSMLPVNKKYPIDEILAACREYISATGRRVSFEWALIRDINDTPEQARMLATKLRGSFGDAQHRLLCHVNVIPLNPTQGYPGQPTTRHRVEKFKEILEHAGVACTIRLRRGVKIRAGCGQLVGCVD